mmetsp:Transcript_42740/g.108522  ORF Transcript_42740/g.108522 Transcript_42740/m.108522 type:complete len:155 (-) Transcript_42740:75-539(-)
MVPAIVSLEKLAALSGMGMSDASSENVWLSSGFRIDRMSHLDLVDTTFCASDCSTESSTFDAIGEFSTEQPANGEQSSGSALQRLAHVGGLDAETLAADFRADEADLEERLVHHFIVQGAIQTSISRAEVAKLLMEAFWSAPFVDAPGPIDRPN